MSRPDWLQRLLGALLGVALFAAALIFASALLAVAAVAALLVWAWLWWRRRNLPQRPGEGLVIEGEYRVESDEAARNGERRE